MTPEQWDHAVSIAAGVATIIAAGAAVMGLWAWRQQLRGTTEYRAALRTYLAITRLRDRIRSAREPWNHLVPTYEGEPSHGDTPEFVERERQDYWNYFREVIRADLAMLGLRGVVELHWDSEATAHIDALDEAARRLRGGYKAYFEFRRRAVSGEPGYSDHIPDVKKIIFSLKPPFATSDEYGDLMEQRARDALAYFRRRAGLPEPKAEAGPSPHPREGQRQPRAFVSARTRK